MQACGFGFRDLIGGPHLPSNIRSARVNERAASADRKPPRKEAKLVCSCANSRRRLSHVELVDVNTQSRRVEGGVVHILEFACAVDLPLAEQPSAGQERHGASTVSRSELEPRYIKIFIGENLKFMLRGPENVSTIATLTAEWFHAPFHKVSGPRPSKCKYCPRFTGPNV